MQFATNRKPSAGLARFIAKEAGLEATEPPDVAHDRAKGADLSGAG